MAESEDISSSNSSSREDMHFFEGVEKLLEIWFEPNPANKNADLRKIPSLTTHIKPDSTHSASSTHTMLPPSSPNSPDSDMNAALLRPSATVGTGAPLATGESDFVANNNMFGKFKGFTLQPLPQSKTTNQASVHGGGLKKTPKVAFVQPVAKYSQEDTTSNAVPARAAPPVPVSLKTLAHEADRSNSNSSSLDNVTTYNKPAGNAASVLHGPTRVNGCKLANHEHQLDAAGAPALPPMNPGSTARPIISSPILESSTCTSRELIAGGGGVVGQKGQNVPIRPAPTMPPPSSLHAAADNSLSSSGSLHSSAAVDPTSNAAQLATADVLINPVSKDKKPKESKLNRITSYLKKEEKPPKPEPKQLKVIDKEKLRNIDISAPIPIDQSLAKSMPKLADSEEGERLTAPGATVPATGTVVTVQRAKSMRDPESTVGGGGSQRKVRIVDDRSESNGSIGSGSGKKAAGLKRPQSMVGTRPTIPPPRPPIPAVSMMTSTSTAAQQQQSALKIPGMPGYQNPPPPKSVTIVAPGGRNEYDDCRDPVSTGGGQSSLGADNIYAVIDESPSPPSILSPPAISSGGSSESMGLLGEIVNEIESRHGDSSVYIASTLRRSGGSRKSSSLASQPSVVANGATVSAQEDNDDDEPTYVNTSDLIDDDDDFDATEDDEDDDDDDDDGGMADDVRGIHASVPVGVANNRNSGLSTTSSGYLRPSAISTGAPIARIAPSTNGATSEKPTTNGLSSFKSITSTPAPTTNGSGTGTGTGTGGNVLNQIKFQGPTVAKEPPKKTIPSTAGGPSSSTTTNGGSSYKPYHSVLTNSARSGSVVAAAKAKIASEKSNPPPPGGSGGKKVTTAPTQPTTSVRTRTPSPRGSVVGNGTVPNGTVATGKGTTTAVKPKPAAKPEPLTAKPKTTPSATTTTTGGGGAGAGGSVGNGKLLTAAARPGPGKVSNVASLQQKFEGRK